MKSANPLEKQTHRAPILSFDLEDKVKLRVHFEHSFITMLSPTSSACNLEHIDDF